MRTRNKNSSSPPLSFQHGGERLWMEERSRFFISCATSKKYSCVRCGQSACLMLACGMLCTRKKWGLLRLAGKNIKVTETAKAYLETNSQKEPFPQNYQCYHSTAQFLYFLVLALRPLPVQTYFSWSALLFSKFSWFCHCSQTIRARDYH